jgi:(R,R)-butanediol dehydrogenase/meso-butanediol dehydrogenase/diacetyl reductase
MAEKMKAVLYMKDQAYSLLDVDIPPMTPNKVKVKIKYCAFCATDAHVVFNDLYNRPKGFGLGHEISGIVEDVGSDVAGYGIEPGDHVMVWPLFKCGKCDFCKQGLGTYCVDRNAARFPGFAEYCVVDINQVFKVPNNGDLISYALVEPMTCAIRGIDLADIKIGQNVAISGVGGIGLILLNMILLQGGANITAIDPVPAKRELALKMGARHVIDPSNDDIEKHAADITNGKGFDIVFEASGSALAAPSCLKLLALRGTVVYFAVYPMDYALPINLYELYMTEGKIKTAYCDSNDIARAIQLVPSMNTDLIIGKTYSLNDIDKVFDTFKKSIYPKIIVDCDLDHSS